MTRLLAFAIATVSSFSVLTAGAASAQDRRPSHCIAIADAAPGIEYLHFASYAAPLPDEFTVRINYVDHAMFLIETAGGLTAATDYTGFLGSTDLVPDVVTMNNSHSTHWTANPDPRIPHVLEGWATAEAPRDHYLDLGEMLVRNVHTDARGWQIGQEVRSNGNSIFVFEVAGLCIGHLGHLHHIPDDQQFAALGRLDVVMAAVDGGITIDLPSMVSILDRLRSSIVIPMHWFSTYSLQQFVDDMEAEGFAIDRAGSSIEVSLRTLPSRPTVMVMQPQFLRDAGDD